tara:strand:- start:653 stop:1000 length:348 start_codon:yes stop_codon:yes gene_type:complete
MNQMESTSPIHKWVEKLEPGDLIRVSYGSRAHYMGVFQHCRKRGGDWLLRYYDMPSTMHDNQNECWATERLEKSGQPPSSYIYGYSIKDRVHPAQEWMMTGHQNKYYKKLKKFIR